MHLTQYTDFALRTLIALAVSPAERSTVSEISHAYQISRHHLVKVAGRLAELGFIETMRGKGGGLRLARRPQRICIGEVVRAMEAELGVVECLTAGGGRCVIAPACRLKSILHDATARFLEELDQYTLADVLKSRVPLARLLGIPVSIEPART
jgi:Rrf2 family transcriptional regulator, nitric oxide-sensitive transcriptional repressor